MRAVLKAALHKIRVRVRQEESWEWGGFVIWYCKMVFKKSRWCAEILELVQPNHLGAKGLGEGEYTDGWQIKGKALIKKYRNISNADASEHQGSLNGLVSMKMTQIKCYSLYSRQISTLLHTYVEDFGPMCKTMFSTTITMTPNDGIQTFTFKSI